MDGFDGKNTGQRLENLAMDCSPKSVRTVLK